MICYVSLPPPCNLRKNPISIYRISPIISPWASFFQSILGEIPRALEQTEFLLPMTEYWKFLLFFVPPKGFMHFKHVWKFFDFTTLELESRGGLSLERVINRGNKVFEIHYFELNIKKSFKKCLKIYLKFFENFQTLNKNFNTIEIFWKMFKILSITHYI